MYLVVYICTIYIIYPKRATSWPVEVSREGNSWPWACFYIALLAAKSSIISSYRDGMHVGPIFTDISKKIIS